VAWRAFALVCLLAIGRTGPAAAAPLEAYGRLPSLEQVQISPDGTAIAFVNTADDGQRSIAVVRIADQKPLIVANVGKTKIRDLIWADDQNLLLTTSATTSADDAASGLHAARGEYYFLETLNVPTGHVTKLLDKVENLWSMIYGAPHVRIVGGRTYVLVETDHIHDAGNAQSLALARIDLANGDTRVVIDGQADTSEWLIDAAGQPIAETRYRETTGQWSLYLWQAGRWLLNKAIDAPDSTPELDGINRDGSAILVKTPSGPMQAVALSDGVWRADPDDDKAYRLHDPVSRRLIAAGDDSLTFFDPRIQAGWAGIAKAFAGERVDYVSASARFDKFVVKVEGAKDGSSFSLIDLTTHQAVWLGDEYAGVTPADIAEVRPVTYPAADGLKISGYLTLPNGRPAKGLPLIVFPHGGPEANDDGSFDWWAQAMASRGYAVLQPNFRGSTGAGADFIAAAYGQWGRKMQTDLSDGVRYLAAQGTIDPKRVCIVGASYGGYAAMAGATLDAGVYRCAVAVSGISDLKRFRSWTISEAGGSRNATTRYWDRLMGVKDAQDPVLEALSPARQAAKAQGPILLIHGKDDTVVPYDQSRVMAETLTQQGKPVTLITLNAEDHWLSRSETRLQMLNASMAFIEANNPP